MVKKAELKAIATVLRKDSLEMTTAAGSGHPTSCLSCAEIMAVLLFSEMRFDVNNPRHPNNDEFILSKGHAAPILYSAFYRAGAVKGKLKTLRKFNSKFEGHPLPATFPWAKVATGSLGQGLSAGIGMALAAKLQKKEYRTYVLMGDSEVAEGSVYEALQIASHYKLNNLCAIIDVNRLGQRGATMHGHHMKKFKAQFTGFGWQILTIEGHDIDQIKSALKKARKEKQKPTLILAKTYKGRGISFLENKNGWHGKALSKEQLQKALHELPNKDMPKISIKKRLKKKKLKKKKYTITTKYHKTQKVATREAYGNALATLAKKHPYLLAADGEVSNSTHADEIKKVNQKQFVEGFIAEQNLISMAAGLSAKGFDVCASTFAAFLTRAHDQIRMTALSNIKITIVGSHAGISIGADGPSQMGLSDIALFRALPNSTVLYPADAVTTEKLLARALNKDGITYLRTTRPKTPILYANNTTFPVGGVKVVKKSTNDKIAILAAGITVHEAIKAVEQTKKAVRVIDCYSIKPIHKKNLLKKIGTIKKIIVVEDHYLEGGLGEAVQSALANENEKIIHLAVKKLPHSGSAEKLMKHEKIDAKEIKRVLEK